MNAQMTVKQGVLLVNLGMPDDTSVRAIRRYLTDFLIDRRVVNIPPALWLPILYSFILPFRPKRLVANYAAIEIDGKMPVHIYNKALAQNTEANLQQAGHSIRVVSAMTYGNPSIQAGLETLQSEQIEEAIAAKLKLSPYQWLLTYQPRIGAEEWLQPFTSDTLKNLPAQGVKKLLVICPGFAADCLETLEEIDIENKAVFMQAGGVSYNYIPCLNDQQSHVELMKTLIMANL